MSVQAYMWSQLEFQSRAEECIPWSCRTVALRDPSTNDLCGQFRFLADVRFETEPKFLDLFRLRQQFLLMLVCGLCCIKRSGGSLGGLNCCGYVCEFNSAFAMAQEEKCESGGEENDGCTGTHQHAAIVEHMVKLLVGRGRRVATLRCTLFGSCFGQRLFKSQALH